MLYLSTLFGLILSILYPDILCRPWSQSVSSFCLGIWWEAMQFRYENWWCHLIEEEQSYFLCGQSKLQFLKDCLQSWWLVRKWRARWNQCFPFICDLPPHMCSGAILSPITCLKHCVGWYTEILRLWHLSPIILDKLHSVQLCGSFYSCHKWTK